MPAASTPPATPPRETGPEPAVAPPPGHPRFPHVDGLRALAALSVLAYHTSFFSRAHQESALGPVLARLNIGVPIFFAISGFLLYRPFAAARLEAWPRPRAGAYARRRFLRIVPAYWVALSILALYPGADGLWSGEWPLFYGFAQAYSVRTVLAGIGPAWTLCSEAAFYVLLPLYAWSTARVLGSRAAAVRRELALLGALALGSAALRAGTFGADVGTLGQTLPALFAWFAVGMAVAVVSSAATAGLLRAPRVPALGAWIVAGGLYLVMCYTLGAPEVSVFADRPTRLESLFEFVMSGLVAGVLLLPAVFGTREGGLPRRLLAARPVAWLGLVSYGIYLWHWSIAKWLLDLHVLEHFSGAPFLSLTGLTLAITVPIAALSYYLVERPILRFKEGRPRRRGAAEPARAPVA